MPKLKPNTILPDAAEDAAITAAALADSDNPPLSDAFIKGMKPYKGRGRPAKADTKLAISVRFDADVVAAFKATGKGWQTRMNDVLTDYVNTHKL